VEEGVEIFLRMPEGNSLIDALPKHCRVLIHMLLTVWVILGQGVFAPAHAGVDADLAEKYKKHAASVDDKAISETIRTLSSQGSRVVGYPGEIAAAQYIEGQFKTLFGADKVQSEVFTASVPMDEGATLETGGKSYKIFGMWPNLVRTSQTPPEGLNGPLVYGGNGKLSALNGKQIEGAIVLLDFNCTNEWLNAARLGAKAIIFIEPSQTIRGEAEAKFISVPLATPRFYIQKSDAATLLALSTGRASVTAKVACKMPWKRVQAKNFLGILPGRSTDPKIAKQIIVVQAYYDGMSVVPALSPSAESAAGIAGLLQTAKNARHQRICGQAH
jgi:hypothetical protein